MLLYLIYDDYYIEIKLSTETKKEHTNFLDNTVYSTLRNDNTTDCE